MNQSSLNGIVIGFLGSAVAVVGYLVLSIFVASTCWSQFVWPPPCSIARDMANLVFYTAIAGAALLTLGVWQACAGRVRITPVGGLAVVSLGISILGLGFWFLTAFLPTPWQSSFSALAGIVFVFGLLGEGLLMGGIVKLAVGTRTVLPAGLKPTLGIDGKEPNVLRVFSLLFGTGSQPVSSLDGWLKMRL